MSQTLDLRKRVVVGYEDRIDADRMGRDLEIERREHASVTFHLGAEHAVPFGDIHILRKRIDALHTRMHGGAQALRFGAFRRAVHEFTVP